MRNLAISNIAWTAEDDADMYSFLLTKGYRGLEIAPTRIFQDNPYEHLSEAKDWALQMKEQYGLEVPSMQSIWYGHTEKIFGSKEERKILLDYTKRAIDFFKEIGDYALEHNTVVALEPNPIIYNTHFMNYTEQAVEMAYKANSDGIKVNVDLGTIIYNEEDLNYLKQIPEYISHVHISEPYLRPVNEKHKEMHRYLVEFGKSHPDIYISIEMGKSDIDVVKNIIDYISELRYEEQ